MADKPLAADLTADLPVDWAYGQTVAPTGAEAGLPEQYGFNYLMEKVNEARTAINAVNRAFAALAALDSNGKIPAERLPEITPEDIGALPANGTAASATKLATARGIDGVSFDGSRNITHYGTCSTEAATAAKAVDCTGFVLAAGSRIVVKFTVTNTAAGPTLNVNGTGAKPIYYRGSAISAGYLAANRTYEFVYNGAQYELVGDINTNTTYTAASAAPKAPGTAAAGTSAKYAREDHVHPVQTTVSGNAGTATKLATARTILTNLASTGTASFNGTANVSPGVTGILGISNGGTGCDSLDELISKLMGQNVAKIAAGTYKGTGTHGSSNPCSLTFDFPPQMLVISKVGTAGKATENMPLIMVRIPDDLYTGTKASSDDLSAYVWLCVHGGVDLYNETVKYAYVRCNWKESEGKTVSWYSIYGADSQMNEKTNTNYIYAYIAIG